MDKACFPAEFEGSFATHTKYFAHKYLQTDPTTQVNLNSSFKKSHINFLEICYVNNKLCACVKG